MAVSLCGYVAEGGVLCCGSTGTCSGMDWLSTAVCSGPLCCFTV